MHKILIRKLIETENPEAKQYMEHLLFKMLDDIKHNDCVKYHDIKRELYKHTYGNHLCEIFARKWVDKMKNEDGTIGGHWSVEETEGVNTKHYDKWDWYATLNMFYSDYYTPRFTTNDYVMLADKFLSDKDAPADKLLRYFFYIADKEE